MLIADTIALPLPVICGCCTSSRGLCPPGPEGTVVYLFNHPCWPWSSKHFNRPEQVTCQPCSPQLPGTVVTSSGFCPLCLPLEEGSQIHREQVGGCSREDIAAFPVHSLFQAWRKGWMEQKRCGSSVHGEGSAGAGAPLGVEGQGESRPSLQVVARNEMSM